MKVEDLESFLRHFPPSARVTFWLGTEFELLLQEVEGVEKDKTVVEVTLNFSNLDDYGD